MSHQIMRIGMSTWPWQSLLARRSVGKFSHVFLPRIILLTAWCRTLSKAKCLARAQEIQKYYADKKPREVSFNVSNKVLLSSTKNLKLQNPDGRHKLDWPLPYHSADRQGCSEIGSITGQAKNTQCVPVCSICHL